MENNIYPNLGNNIKALRKSFELTQFEMALDLDISESAISQYENNIQIPERDILILIAKYFKITENELLYSDFTNIKRVDLKKFDDTNLQISIFKEMFPIIYTEEAIKNNYFKEAYDKQMKIYDFVISNVKSPRDLTDEEAKQLLDKIENYTNLYKKAYKDGIVESVINILWWMMIEGYIYSFLTPCNEDLLNMNDKINSNELYKLMFLNKPDIEKLYNEINLNYEKDRIEYIKNTEKDFFKSIAILKKTKKYSDLADYYISFRYCCGLYDNSLTVELNRTIGCEIANTYKIIGNKYLRKLLSYYQ